MIVLDISPALINTDLPAWDMKTEPEPDSPQSEKWETTQIYCADSSEPVCTIRQAQNPHHTVRFFDGKGGRCVIVSDETVLYFGLPGSCIRLPDTEVTFPGEIISGKGPQVRSASLATVQTVTDQAMILGAGLATRFEPISGDTTGYPKPAVPLCGEDTVIAALVKLLQRHGFKKIFINTFYKPDSLKAQLSHITDVDIHYIDEESPSGTAGGLVQALKHDALDCEKSIFVIQGDAITDANLSLLINVHAEGNDAVTIGGQIVPDSEVNKFGIIETDGAGTDGQSGHITSFKEKPSLAEAGHSRFANAGFYVLSPAVLQLFLETGESVYQNASVYDYAEHFFHVVLQRSLNGDLKDNKGQPMRFWAQAMAGYWSDVGNPTQYFEALHDLYQGHVDLTLPDTLSDYYEAGIFYWPGAKSLASQARAQLSGNVLVACQAG